MYGDSHALHLTNYLSYSYYRHHGYYEVVGDSCIYLII